MFQYIKKYMTTVDVTTIASRLPYIFQFGPPSPDLSCDPAAPLRVVSCTISSSIRSRSGRVEIKPYCGKNDSPTLEGSK